MQGPAESASLRDLLGDIVTRITVLLRKELDLARSEMAQNLNRAAFGVGLLVAGIVLALVALNVLAVAAVLAVMAAGMGAIGATLIVGGAALAIAVALAAIGIARAKPARLAPTRSIDQLRRNADTAREAFHA